MIHAQRLAREHKFLTVPRAALIRRWRNAIRDAVTAQATSAQDDAHHNTSQ